MDSGADDTKRKALGRSPPQSRRPDLGWQGKRILMRALFGVVSLLVALAIVGLVAVKQLKAVGQRAAPAAAEAGVPAVPQLSGSGTVRQQTQQLQNKVADDVAKAMSQGADARRQEADKP